MSDEAQQLVDRAMESYRLAHMIVEGKFGPALAEAIPHLRSCADDWGKALRSKTRADVLVELGKLHQRLDDHAAALNAYHEAGEIYRTINERHAIAYCYMLEAMSLTSMGRLPEALAVGEQALAQERDGGDLANVSRMLLVVAGIHMDLEQYDRALACFADAMPILARFGKNAEAAQAHELTAVCQHRLKCYDLASTSFELAINAKRDLGNLRGAAKIMVRFAELERDRKAYAQALALHKRALDIHRLRNDQAMIAQSLGNIGTIQTDLGDWPAALANFQECAQLLRTTGERPSEAQTFSNLHVVQLKMGDEQGALASLEKALEICRTISNRQMRERIIHAAVVLRRQRGEGEEEIKLLQELRQVRESAGDLAGVAGALDDLAVLYHGFKRLADTRACLERRAEILEELGDQAALLRTLDDLAGLAVEQEDWSRAADHSERSLAICRARSMPAADLASRCYNLGLIHARRVDHGSALESYRQAHQLWGEANNADQAARSLRQMGGCELQISGLSRDALGHFQEALSHYESSGDKRGIALALVGIGNAHANLRDSESAKAAFDRAAALKEELGDQRGTSVIRKATSIL